MDEWIDGGCISLPTFLDSFLLATRAQFVSSSNVPDATNYYDY